MHSDVFEQEDGALSHLSMIAGETLSLVPTPETKIQEDLTKLLATTRPIGKRLYVFALDVSGTMGNYEMPSMKSERYKDILDACKPPAQPSGFDIAMAEVCRLMTLIPAGSRVGALVFAGGAQFLKARSEDSDKVTYYTLDSPDELGTSKVRDLLTTAVGRQRVGKDVSKTTLGQRPKSVERHIKETILIKTDAPAKGKAPDLDKKTTNFDALLTKLQHDYNDNKNEDPPSIERHFVIISDFDHDLSGPEPPLEPASRQTDDVSRKSYWPSCGRSERQHLAMLLSALARKEGTVTTFHFAHIAGATIRHCAFLPIAEEVLQWNEYQKADLNGEVPGEDFLRAFPSTEEMDAGKELVFKHGLFA